jgi:hypothetical protein
MKRLLFVILATSFSAALVQAQTASTTGKASAVSETSAATQGRQVNLQSNTALAAKLENSLDASRAKVGDQVVLKTTQAIKQNGEVIVPKGSKLIGHVTEVQQRTKANGQSRIGVAFDRLQKGALDIPITASIVSIAQARSQTRANDSSADSETMAAATTNTTTRSSSSGQGSGGLLGGVGNTVGGAVNTTTSTVGNVAGATTNAVGSTVGATTNTAGNLSGPLKGLQITQSTSASAEGGSTLSLNSGNLRLESGATFNLLVSSSTNAGTRQ